MDNLSHCLVLLVIATAVMASAARGHRPQGPGIGPWPRPRRFLKNIMDTAHSHATAATDHVTTHVTNVQDTTKAHTDTTYGVLGSAQDATKAHTDATSGVLSTAQGHMGSYTKATTGAATSTHETLSSSTGTTASDHVGKVSGILEDVHSGLPQKDIYRRSPRPGPLPYAAMNPMSFYGPHPGQHRRVSRKAPGPFRRVR